METKVIALTDQNFDHYVEQKTFLAIDFWASWCEPCKDFSRIFTELASEHPDFCFATVDVDTEKKLAQDFSVKSVPTFAIIRNKVMIFYQSGVMPKSALAKLLSQAKELEEIAF